MIPRASVAFLGQGQLETAKGTAGHLLLLVEMACYIHLMCLFSTIWLHCLATTPACVVGTGSVFMPSPGSGKCYCGATTADPAGGDVMGYCTPDPYDEGLTNQPCARGGDEAAGGSCGYYCVCAAAMASKTPADITCCNPGTTMGLKSGTVIAAEDSSTIAYSNSYPAGLSFAV